LNAIQALSQLSYGPETGSVFFVFRRFPSPRGPGRRAARTLFNMRSPPQGKNPGVSAGAAAGRPSAVVLVFALAADDAGHFRVVLVVHVVGIGDQIVVAVVVEIDIVVEIVVIEIDIF
jgi:hypothetical protein